MNLIHRPAAAAVKRLLNEAKLPTSDLTAAHHETFLGYGDDGALNAVVGLELYAPVASLRSLAVTARLQRNGVATTLLAEAEGYARHHG